MVSTANGPDARAYTWNSMNSFDEQRCLHVVITSLVVMLSAAKRMVVRPALGGPALDDARPSRQNVRFNACRESALSGAVTA